MTVTRRVDGSSIVRLLAMLAAAALVLAVLPVGVAEAQENGEADINGEVIFTEASPDEERIASLRFAGQQRFATASLIALETWASSDRAILARHDEWPDALAGGYLAGVFDAPVLLVSQQNLQDDTLTALEGLGVSEVTILGGTQAISEASENRLRDDLGYDVDRISGPTRFETAVEIAEQGEVGMLDGQRTAFVATGINFADALAAGPLAYDGGFPILLTPSQSLHPATEQALQDLEIEHVLLLGGTGAISSDVEDAIRDAIEGDEDSITRLQGTTRVETAADVALFAVGEMGFTPFEHGWARGNDFADALTIGPRLGELRGPLLLVPTPNLADSGEGTNAMMAEEVRCLTSLIDIAGGTAAVSENVENTLRELLACPEEALTLTLDAEPFQAEAGESIDVTATVRSNIGAGVADVDVAFEAESVLAQPTLTPEDGTTDENGEVVTTVESPTPGFVEITGMATRDSDGLVLEDFITIEFTIPNETSFFLVELSSEQETDEDTAALDPPVTGFAVLWLSTDDDRICWEILLDPIPGEHDIGSFEDFGPVNAHIHGPAAPGADAGVVIALGQVQDDTLEDSGCEDAPGPGDLADVETDPVNYYVNVHTDEYPGGIVRGQLEAEDEENGDENGEFLSRFHRTR